MAIKRLIVVLVLVCGLAETNVSVASDEDRCIYKTEQVKENGVVVNLIENKTCVETENLSKQNFFITWLTDEKYQNSVVLIFMGILENL